MVIGLLGCRLMDGQHDLERGAFAHFALHGDAAVVAFNDAMRDRQAQTRAHPNRFGGEERIENIFHVLFGHATARIGYGEEHMAVVCRGGDANQTPLRWVDGLCGIDHQIQHHLVDL